MRCGKAQQTEAIQRILMDEFVNFWPIVSGVIVVAALAVAFRAEITVRVRVLEEKVSALFQIINDRKE
jgi:hypothetical protein